MPTDSKRKRKHHAKTPTRESEVIEVPGYSAHSRQGEVMPTDSKIRVAICDPEHPHYPETGELTGEVISLFGEPMAKMALDDCKHGTDACFVSKGQVCKDRRERVK